MKATLTAFALALCLLQPANRKLDIKLNDTTTQARINMLRFFKKLVTVIPPSCHFG
jgi:hypothetical protein